MSNELEKETSVLYVMGFSMADEHIREIVLRAAKDNPTLNVFILAYNIKAYEGIKANMNGIECNNIQCLLPPDNKDLDFGTINELFFSELINSI